MIRLTTLVENSATSRGLLGEHGLAILVESGQRRYLWDAGGALSLRHNHSHLGITPGLDAICISHGHHDHTSGLIAALELFGPCPVYLQPGADQPRYRGAADKPTYIGVPWRKEELLRAGGTLVAQPGPVWLDERVMLTGGISDREPVVHGDDFWVERSGELAVDDFVDDQAMVIDTGGGLVVLVGCSHAGIANTVSHVRSITGRPVCAIIGGLHLLRATDEHIDQTIAQLIKLGVHQAFPCHCTGLKATARILATIGGRENHAGSVIEL